jgi:hypothetical protein
MRMAGRYDTSANGVISYSGKLAENYLLISQDNKHNHSATTQGKLCSGAWTFFASDFTDG